MINQTTIPQFPRVVIRDERGDLRGLLIGRDPVKGQSLVAVTQRDAPGWFWEQHVSNCPHVWVRSERVVVE